MRLRGWEYVCPFLDSLDNSAIGGSIIRNVLPHVRRCGYQPADHIPKQHTPSWVQVGVVGWNPIVRCSMRGSYAIQIFRRGLIEVYVGDVCCLGHCDGSSSLRSEVFDNEAGTVKVPSAEGRHKDGRTTGCNRLLRKCFQVGRVFRNADVRGRLLVVMSELKMFLETP